MYKFLEHTSDIIIEAKNKDFASTLADIATGMFTQMGEASSTNASIDIQTKATSKEELVVTFLSEIIAQCEIEMFTPKKIEILNYDDKSISAKIYGEKKPSENIIKAVTYHELEIEEKDKCRIKVLFDI